MSEMLGGMDRTRKFALVFVLVLVVALVAGAWLGQRWRPFGGEFDNVGLMEVEGKLTRTQLFCLDNNPCKWLWAIKVSNAEKIGTGALVSSIPEEGDTITIDVGDSRANLFSDLADKECRRDTEPESGWRSPVRICEHAVYETYAGESGSTITVTVMEVRSDSSGMPEWTGVPR